MQAKLTFMQNEKEILKQKLQNIHEKHILGTKLNDNYNISMSSQVSNQSDTQSKNENR